MDDRITLRLSSTDVVHLDAIRGGVARGPFLRRLLRQAGRDEPYPSPEQIEAEARARGEAHTERLRIVTRG